MPARPVVRALIARKLSHGAVGRSRLVSLQTAYLALQSGVFVVVGPDPEDVIALATWEREQAQPFNQPRITP